MKNKKFKNIQRILRPKSEEDIRKTINVKIQSNPQNALKEFVTKVIPKGIEVFLSDGRRRIFIDTSTIYDIKKLRDHHNPTFTKEQIDFIVGSEYSIFLLVYIGILYSSKILDYLYSYFPDQTKFAYEVLNYMYDIDRISFHINDNLYNEKEFDMQARKKFDALKYNLSGIYVTDPPKHFISDNTPTF